MELERSLENKTSTAAQAELEKLRHRAAELEEVLLRQESIPTNDAKHQAAQSALEEPWVLAAGQASPYVNPRVANHPDAITLQLSPEEHDGRMEELISVLQEKGLTKAIIAAEATNNPHLIDDFHRILVEWVREGLKAKGLSERKYKTALSLALFEVTLPGNSTKKDKQTDPTKEMRDFISLMEQFYRSMQQIDTKKGEYFSFEIANPAGDMQTSVYIAVPQNRKSMFEKQLLSLFPAAKLVEKRDDYNAFADNAETAAAQVRLTERSIYSLRTFEDFSNDPLDALFNAFSKLDETGEGAAIQFIISPRDRGLLKRYRRAMEKIRTGVPIYSATNIKTGFGHFVQEFIINTLFEAKKLDPDQRPASDDPRLQNIEKKIKAPLFLSDIRIVASAKNKHRAEEILQDMEGPLQQFADTAGNRFSFKLVSPRATKKFAHMFSYRLLDEKSAMVLSAAELATLAHLPGSESRKAAPALRQERSNVSAPPVDLALNGAIIGVNNFRATEREIRIAPEDRLRHLYVIGQTGTGKSTLLKNIIIQDILSGAGVCMIDPHGNDVVEILSAIPPERMNDVIYFDPGATERPIGLNMMEYDPERPEQKTLVVDELLGIFKKLFGAVPESMGPAFEQYFRNAALLVMDDPASGNTLLDISRVFSDSVFRSRKLAACKNPIVLRFWKDIAMQASGEQGLENYAPYVTNKFDAFTTNEIVRPIISQQKSAFNFRDVMDNKKILLVNLAKGRIGELNANLLGLVIVGKFLIAALSRADSVGKDLPAFYLHIDEFQNFTTPSISAIFSEARKYKLSLTVAHQFIAQLTDEIRDAVFGNVGSICSFRVGSADAEFLEKQFAPTFSATDLMNVDNRNAYVKLLINGRPAQPFNIETLQFKAGDMSQVDKVRELSYLKYGRPRAEVELDLNRRLSNIIQDPELLRDNR